MEKALLRIVAGEPGALEAVIEEFESTQTTPETVKLLSSLSSCSALIAGHHAAFATLLGMLYEFSWECDDLVAEAFGALLRSLVSAHAGFLEPSFELLVRSLRPSQPDLQTDDPDAYEALRSGDPAELRRVTQRCEQIHTLIPLVLRVCPLGCGTLLQALLANYPSDGEDTFVHVWYLREMLRVGDYVPVLRDRVLAFGVSRVISMDVKIRLADLDDDYEDDGSSGGGAEREGSTGVFMMEEDRASALDAEAQRVREIARTLDALLGVLFDYIDSQLDLAVRSKAYSRVFFELVLNIFDRTVMRTKSCDFAQFLVYYAARRSSRFSGELLSRLMRRALSDEEPLEVQTAAASYLASFIARANFLKRSAIDGVLSELARWAQAYIAARTAPAVRNGTSAPASSPDAPPSRARSLARSPQTSSPRSPAPVSPSGSLTPSRTCTASPGEAHVRFYFVCQAAFYAIVFKGRALGREALLRMNWRNVVKSSLQPLTYCMPDVVEEFVRVSSVIGLDLLPDTAAHKRRRAQGLTRPVDATPGDAHCATLTRVRTELSRHGFPFDPCVLRVSAERIAPHFQGFVAMTERDVSTTEASDADITADDRADTADEDVEDAYAADGDEEYRDNDAEVTEFSSEHLRMVERQQGAKPRVPCSAIKVPGISRHNAQLQMLGALAGATGGTSMGDSFWGLAFLPKGPTVGTTGSSTSPRRRTPRSSFAADSGPESLAVARVSRHSFAASEDEVDAPTAMSITPVPNSAKLMADAVRSKKAADAIQSGDGSW